MKKILTILLILISFSGFSQVSTDLPNYPIYQFDSTHQIMTVVFSLKQAQTIDNDYEYLELLEKSRSGCDSLAKSYQILVTDMGRVIAQQDITIEDLYKLNDSNKRLIDGLNAQIKKYIEDGIKCDSLLKNKDDQIASFKKENLKLRVQKTVGFVGLGTFGGVALGVSVYMILKSTGVIH